MSGTAPFKRMGRDLAEARRTGVPAQGLELSGLASQEEALTVQGWANIAYGRSVRGWTMAATSALTARLLHLDRPVVASLFDEDVVPTGSTYRLPHGMLGIGCGLAFVFGRSFPVGGDQDRDVGSAIAQVYACLQLLGRRVPNLEPLNPWTATADFGLDVLHVRGPGEENWRELDLAHAELSLWVDGNVVGHGKGSDVLGDPLRAVAALSRTRVAQGGVIEAGDIVAVGSCTGLSQVIPGHLVTGRCDMLGSVSLIVQ